MKKVLVVSLIMLLSTSIFAKKVKFSVDMTGQTVNANGVHVAGDFQIKGGYSSVDWDPAACTMLQEDTTNIYSIIVDIPAFHKYEYRFINGNLFYESEFIPVESRVGYDFNDNRWIYVDSLANDTSIIGAILFGGNAPEGKRLVRFLVNMSSETVSAHGVYMAGSYNIWGYKKAPLYSFGSNIYEIIQYMPDGNYEFKFAKDYNTSDAEIVPSGCSTNNNRTTSVIKDTIISPVCYASCDICIAGIKNTDKTIANIYPNPSNGSTTIYFIQMHNDIKINDAKGALIKSYRDYLYPSLTIDNLKTGIYFIFVSNISNKEQSAYKYIVQQ